MRVARLSQPGARDGPGGGEEEALVAPERASEPLLRNPGPCGWMQPVMGVGSGARVPAQPPRPKPILAEAVCWAGALRGASKGRGTQVALCRPW